MLTIDDDPQVMDFIRTIAQDQNFEVHATGRSVDFMECFKSLSPDGIVMDLAVPEIDGVELLRWLGKEGCKAGIVIVSGFDRPIVKAARNLGEASGLRILDALEKPVRVATLREALARVELPA